MQRMPLNDSRRERGWGGGAFVNVIATKDGLFTEYDVDAGSQ